MKREGRQHGVVRTYAILPDPFYQPRRHVQTVDSASVTGLFTKVSRKPTNQSKFTGKCGKSGCNGCHVHPASKSKDKTKGTMKLRSIGSDHDVNDYSAAGISATSALAFDPNYEDIDVYDDGAINDYDYDYDDYDYGYETNVN